MQLIAGKRRTAATLDLFSNPLWNRESRPTHFAPRNRAKSRRRNCVSCNHS